MKTIVTYFIIMFIIFPAFIYGQTEIRISQNTSAKYVEPYLAVNPVNGDVLAVYFIQGSDLEYVFIRNNSVLASGSIPNGLDPSCAFDGNGNAYICYLNRNGYEVLVRKAPAGSFTFGSPVVSIQGESQHSNTPDKPLMSIDVNPSSQFYNSIYVSATKTTLGQSRIVFSYSNNSGASFQELTSPLSSITPHGGGTQGAFPVISNTGNVFVYWWETQSVSSRYIKYFQAKSTNGGLSFSSEQQILGEFEKPGVFLDEDFYIKITTSAPLGIRIAPFHSVSIFNNNIYLVAATREKIAGQGDLIISNNLVLLKSTNNGVSWSKKDIEFDLDVFMPAIACDENGRIYITCYDSNIYPFDNKLTSMRFIISDDTGNSFMHLSYTDIFSEATFDPALGQGGFIGDYICAQISNNIFYTVYNKPQLTNNIMQMYFTALPVNVETHLQNLKVENNSLSNLSNSHIKVDGVLYSSPSNPQFNLLREADIEPANTFYNPFRFYKWNDLNTRNSFRNETIFYGSAFITLFGETKSLTVRNYLEGGDGGDILFGESTLPGDVINRSSPFNENAFIYQQGLVNAQYKAEASPTHNLFNTTWEFLSWENGSTNRIREEQISPDSPSEWKAIYKGIQKSDDQNAYANNSQRKFVRNYSGVLFYVYSSLEKVWIEYSTNNGQNWLIGNEGKPLFDGLQAKNPSIEFWNQSTNSTQLLVAAQVNNNGNPDIRVSRLKWQPAQFKEWGHIFAHDGLGTY